VNIHVTRTEQETNDISINSAYDIAVELAGWLRKHPRVLRDDGDVKAALEQMITANPDRYLEHPRTDVDVFVELDETEAIVFLQEDAESYIRSWQRAVREARERRRRRLVP
jgi:hypothetical protein